MGEVAARLFRLGVLAVLLTGAVALAVWVLPIERYDPPQALEVDGRVGSVSVQDTDLRRAAEVRFAWGSPVEVVLSPITSGTVTAVYIEPDDVIECGAALLAVDGADVIAYCGEMPLWREIDETTRGRDVDEFMRFTTELGFPPFADAEAPTRSERRTRLRQFEGIVGLPVDGIVSPGDVYWLSEPVQVARIGVKVGDVLASGGVLASSPAALTEASVTSFESDGESWMFQLDQGQERVAVDADGSIGDVATVESELVRLGLLDDGLPVTASGSIRRVTPITALAVPAAAVVTANGPCVFAVVAADGTASASTVAVPIEIVGSDVGGVLVTAELTPGARVDLEPPGTC